MATSTNTPEKQGRDARERPTPPARKKPNRPISMSKKSPCKSPDIRAVKSANRYSAAKRLSFVRSAGRGLAKEGKIEARARAREWAKNELSRKKKLPQVPPTQVDSSRIIIIDDTDDDTDDDEEEKPKAHTGHDANDNISNSDACQEPCAKCETLYQRMLALDIEKREMKNYVTSTLVDPPNEDDTFYDALEFLPQEHGAAVEDVSDDEDDEIHDLRSERCNRAPSCGQWIEPLEPVGISYSTFVPKQDP